VLQWAFLGNLRTALIVSATIPLRAFAFAIAIALMLVRGESANLLSVGRDRLRAHRRRHC